MVLVLAIALAVLVCVAIFFAFLYIQADRDSANVESRIFTVQCEADERIREADARAKLEIARSLNESRIREQSLIDKLVELSGRPPVIVDTSQAIREIGEAISRITQGPPEAVVENVKLRQEVAEQFARALDGADPGAGVGFVPYGDSDPFMDPELARELNQPRQPAHVANGKLSPERNLSTGRPVEFRSGESGQPPIGGVE